MSGGDVAQIPATIDDANEAWLSEVMGTEVRQRQVTQIGQGIGVMGDIFRADLTYATPADGQPDSVVIKLPSSFEDNRQRGIDFGMFDAEVKFYKELAHEVSAGLPRIYHADIVPGSAEFVIVMEDEAD